MPGRPLGVILAGGRGRRLGGADKALLSLRGRPILDHILDRLAPQVDAVALNANGGPGRFGRWPIPVIADADTSLPGPLAGILAGLRWGVSLGASHIVTVPGDAPFLPADLVARLAPYAPSFAASGGRLHPVIGCWSVTLAELLEAELASGSHRARDWCVRIAATEVQFPLMPLDPFFNINTPADLARAEALLDAARPR